MGEHELVVDALRATVIRLHLFSILHVGFLELWPFDSQYETPVLPGICRTSNGTRISRQDLFVQVCNNLFHIVDPVIPSFECAWAGFPLLIQNLDTVVQLSHALCNLLGCLRVANMRCRECDGVEELLEATILKCSQHTRADLLPGEAAEHAQFALAVDDVLNLWPIHSEQQLGRHFLPGLRLLRYILWRRHHVYGIGQSATETLHFNHVAAVQWDAPPALDSERMRNANDFILEFDPRLALLCLLAA